MAESKEKFILTLSVNKEQKEEIEKFLKEKKWTDIITGSAKEENPKKQKKRKPVVHLSSMPPQRDDSVQEICENSEIVRNPHQASCSLTFFQDPNNYSSEKDSNERQRRCPYCFISPCVADANRTARWIGNGQPENIENATIRKRIYKRFWKIMANNGAWNIPEYVEKKIRIGGGEWVLARQRKLMPECVVDLARQLYPNPKTIPYMNDMWE